jgi:hypothetical protein
MNFKYVIVMALSSLVSISTAQAEQHKGAGHDVAAKHDAPVASHGSSDPKKLFPPLKMNKAKSTPPKKTELIEPAFMAQIPGNSVTLKWNAVDSAENYHLQVATDATFKWLKVDEHFIKRPSYDLTQLESGKTYFWRVAAVKNSNDPMYIKGQFETSSFEIK